MYTGGSNQKQLTCHNCRFNASNIIPNLPKNQRTGFKCPRCGCGLFDGWTVESEMDEPNGGGGAPDVRGKPLNSL